MPVVGQDIHNTVLVGQGIPSIEKTLIESDTATFYFPLPDYLLPKLRDGNWFAMSANRHYPRTGFIHIIETVKNRLLRFAVELEDTVNASGVNLDVDFKKNALPPLLREEVGKLVQVIIMQGENYVSTFDQRNQNVSGNQYNAAGDINFSGIQNQAQYIAELEKLQRYLRGEIQANNIDEETSTDIDYQMTKAIQQAKKPEIEKATLLSHLSKVKDIVTNVAAMAGAVTAITKAIEALQSLPH